MDTRLSVKFKRGGRRPRSHGGYSFLVRGDLPEDRSHILKYLMAAREGLTRDLQDSGKGLTTAQIILIDRITTKLGVVRCMEEHVREHSVMAGDDVAPCLRASGKRTWPSLLVGRPWKKGTRSASSGSRT